MFFEPPKKYDPAKFWRELGLHYFLADCFGIDYIFFDNPPENNMEPWWELGLHYFPAYCFWVNFFFFSGRNFFRLKFEPAKKHSWPDGRTFFSGSNFSGHKYHNWCLCQNTNTNYDPKKLRLEKKDTGCLAGYVVKPPEKITIPPNFGGNWDYIIFQRLFWD